MASTSALATQVNMAEIAGPSQSFPRINDPNGITRFLGISEGTLVFGGRAIAAALMLVFFWGARIWAGAADRKRKMSYRTV